MLYTFIIISLSALRHGSVQGARDSKIVGGTPGYVPYAASIFHKQGFYVCGGAIISKGTVATTARCATVFPPMELVVKYGTDDVAPGVISTDVKCGIRHPNFTFDSPDYDVGVLSLKNPWDERMQIIKLATEEVNDGEQILVHGWGSTEENGPVSEKMQTVRMRKMSRDECRSFYSGKYNITSRMICGTYPGTGLCKGDNGGPVVRNNELVGIISFGLGCGKPGYPGVFANVASPEIRKFLSNFTNNWK